jgi:hypothetical protein
MSGETDYEQLDAQLRELLFSLPGSDAVTIAAESARLRAQAEQIDDEVWRERAISRADRLPQLVAAPQGGSSPEFREAERLIAQGLSAQGSAQERIAEAERLSRQIGELARRAPARESTAILRMNGSLHRLISRLAPR